MKCLDCDNQTHKTFKRCWECITSRNDQNLCPDCDSQRYKTYGRCWDCHVAYNSSKTCKDCKERNRHGGQPRCKPCRSEYVKTHKRYMQNCKLRGRYGISIRDTDMMLFQQDYKCAACKTSLGRTFDTHLDHDHATGAIRGILCRGCNLALGCIQDSKVRLQNLIEYLESYESSETTRLAPSKAGDDIVRPLWRHRECGRNDRVTSEAMLWM